MSEETARAARAGHAGAPLVVEVHRSATAGGRELLGAARAVGGRGGAFVRERGPGGDPERVWERAPTGVDPGDFDREWAEEARAAGLLAVPLGPSAEALRLLPHQGGCRNALPQTPAGPGEREAARLGRRVFEEHTRRLQEEARALREAGAGAGAGGGRPSRHSWNHSVRGRGRQAETLPSASRARKRLACGANDRARLPPAQPRSTPRQPHLVKPPLDRLLWKLVYLS